MTTIKHAQFKKWWIDEDDDDKGMITTTLIIFLLNKKYNEDIEDFIIDADKDEKFFSKIDLLKQFVVIFANSLLFFIPVGFQDWLMDSFTHPYCTCSFLQNTKKLFDLTFRNHYDFVERNSLIMIVI